MEVIAQLGGAATLGPGALLLLLTGLFVRSVMQGALVPRKTFEDLKSDRDLWREAAAIERQRMDAVTKSIDAVLETSRASLAVVEAIQSVTERD